MCVSHHIVDLFGDSNALIHLSALLAHKGRDIPNDDHLIFHSCDKIALSLFQSTAAECAPIGNLLEVLLFLHSLHRLSSGI